MAKIDNEDDLKRKMRRRLVGAVALVTAMVVILPMILESEPKPSDRGIELRIPDKDKAGGFTTQMVVPESAPVAAGELTAEPSSASAPIATSAVPPVAAKPAKAEPAHRAAPVKPAPAKLHASAPKTGFAVQVGAFAKAAAAKELQDKLQKQGWHAYTEKAGEAVRVRVGPYPAREGAEQALQKLEAQGMHPALVNEP
ncbi:MAG TPA: SPOR domain-containing protein [Gallionellaceae bacterium]|nr:SPOR domain-containing protein [Gallionellaceae bacterium]